MIYIKIIRTKRGTSMRIAKASIAVGAALAAVVLSVALGTAAAAESADTPAGTATTSRMDTTLSPTLPNGATGNLLGGVDELVGVTGGLAQRAIDDVQEVIGQLG